MYYLPLTQALATKIASAKPTAIETAHTGISFLVLTEEPNAPFLCAIVEKAGLTGRITQIEGGKYITYGQVVEDYATALRFALGQAAVEEMLRLHGSASSEPYAFEQQAFALINLRQR